MKPYPAIRTYTFDPATNRPVLSSALPVGAIFDCVYAPVLSRDGASALNWHKVRYTVVEVRSRYTGQIERAYRVEAERRLTDTEIEIYTPLAEFTRRVAVVGSRNYPHCADIQDFIAHLPEDAIVVSGGARGVDTWAVEAAQARGLETVVHAAGIARNRIIVNDCHYMVAFWDGSSTGTKHAIDTARAAGKYVVVRTPKGTRHE